MNVSTPTAAVVASHIHTSSISEVSSKSLDHPSHSLCSEGINSSNSFSEKNGSNPSKAWFQVLGAFFLFFNSWGIVSSYGVFQTYYSTTLLHSCSPSAISWIGSVQSCLLLVLGLLFSPLCDRGFIRPMIFGGTILIVAGFILTSFCTEYWQFFLAQAVFVGAGAGALFLPSITVVPMYFSDDKISLATGIVVSGSSIGGIVYSIMFERLIPKLWFGWTTRLMALTVLLTLMIPITIIRARILASSRRRAFDHKTLRDRNFLLFGLAVFLGYMGLYIPFFYI